MINYEKMTSKVPVIMLNYPRCGSNFLNHCIEALIGDLIWKNHGQSYDFWGKDKLPTIVIVRNYKECIPRQLHNNYGLERIKSHMKGNRPTVGVDSVFDYISILNYYEDLEEEKLLIYYEDLIQDTENTLRKVVDFFNKLNIESNDLSEFIKKLPEHKSTSLKSYSPGSSSGGKDMFFHSKKYSDETKIALDNYLIENYSKLWNKYLKRYKN